jgi:predicted ferric reductase
LRYLITGFLWMAAFLFLTLAPLFTMLIEPTPSGRGFWTDFSVALGFTGLSMLGLQFITTARLRFLTLPYGIDVVYHFHRQISLVAFVLILAHPIILFIDNPQTLELLNPITAPWRARFAVAATVGLIIIVATSVWRLEVGLPYETWRLIHSILAVLIIILAMLHVIGVSYYVATPWKQGLWIGLGLIWIGALGYTRIVKPLLLLSRPYRVVDVIEERADSHTLVLRPEGHNGLTFKAGQFAWLSVWNTPFSIREHPFSFASSAVNPETYEFTIKALGDFTSSIDEIPIGQRVYIDGPYGAFSVGRFPADGYVFLAGGIGITPIMSIIRTLADRKDTRELILIYGNPTWEDITFREQLEELQKEINLKVVHVLENPPGSWDGETGFIDADLLARHLPNSEADYEFFICGPDPMLDAVEAALEAREIPPQKIHTERYNLN